MDFDDDKTFYTETMARLCTRQGRYDAAARIYRYLLDQSPDRADLKHALQTVISRMPPAAERWADVSGLIERWVRLVIRQQALQRLERVRLPAAIECGPD